MLALSGCTRTLLSRLPQQHASHTPLCDAQAVLLVPQLIIFQCYCCQLLAAAAAVVDVRGSVKC
jgi:hypothetical protein